MTDQEIESMKPGRDLDREVAEKVFGLKPCIFGVTAMFSAWASIWGCEHKNTSGCYPKNKDAVDHAHSPLAKYSARLEAAWEAVDKYKHYAPVIFRVGGYMHLGEDKRPEGGEWACRFDCAKDKKENYIFGYGEMPAEAIVKAALKVATREENK